MQPNWGNTAIYRLMGWRAGFLAGRQFLFTLTWI